MVRHGDIEGRAVHVLRPFRPADSPVVFRRAIGGAHDQRLAQPVAQRLQSVEGCGVQLEPTGTAAGDLGGREVGPAPERLGHIAEMTKHSYSVGHEGSPWV